MICSGPHKMGCQQRNGFAYDRKALGTGGSWNLFSKRQEVAAFDRGGPASVQTILQSSLQISQPRFSTNIVLSSESALALHRSWLRRRHSMEALCCEGKKHPGLRLCHPTVGCQAFQKFKRCEEALAEYKKCYQHATPAGDAVETQQNAECATANKASVTERDTAKFLLISVNGCSEDKRRR